MSYEEKVWEKLYYLQTEASRALSQVGVHKQYFKDFENLMTSAYQAECIYAYKIAEDLGLSQKHFEALSENFNYIRDLDHEERVEAELERYLLKKQEEIDDLY